MGAPRLLSVCALGLAACGGGPWTTQLGARHLDELSFEDAPDRPRLSWERDVDGAPSTLTLATFNLQRFGPTKASRPEDMEALAHQIAQHPLVAVQEIVDVSGVAPQRLAETLVAQGAPHRLFLGPRTGTHPDDRHFREQYAFFYDPTRLAPVGEGLLFDDSARNAFRREPFIARFMSLEGDLDLVFVNVHTSPSVAVEEIDALFDVHGWVTERYPTSTGVVTLGDLNADCRYAPATALDALEFRGDDFVWAVPDDADTNVAASSCAYDRIVFDREAATYWTGRWGVDDASIIEPASDHWPVWVELYADAR